MGKGYAKRRAWRFFTYAGRPSESALISTGAECSEECGPEPGCDQPSAAFRGSVEEAGSDCGGHGIGGAALGNAAGEVRGRHAAGPGLPGKTERRGVESSATG